MTEALQKLLENVRERLNSCAVFGVTWREIESKLPQDLIGSRRNYLDGVGRSLGLECRFVDRGFKDDVVEFQLSKSWLMNKEDATYYPVRFHGGPLDGQVRQFDAKLMPYVWRQPVEQPLPPVGMIAGDTFPEMPPEPFTVVYELKQMRDCAYRYILANVEEWEAFKQQNPLVPSDLDDARRRLLATENLIKQEIDAAISPRSRVIEGWAENVAALGIHFSLHADKGHLDIFVDKNKADIAIPRERETDDAVTIELRAKSAA